MTNSSPSAADALMSLIQPLQNRCYEFALDPDNRDVDARMMAARKKVEDAIAALSMAPSGLGALMEGNDWRAALIGLCQGHSDTYSTPLKAADNVRRRLRPPAAQSAPSEPIDMVLHCPKCGLQHVDAPDDRTPDWKNEPHRSHLCHGHGCGHIWRPADVPTNGVAAVKTTGKADSPIATREDLEAAKAEPSDNWSKIVSEVESLIDRQYRDSRGDVYTFFGVVHGKDDFYYGMRREGKTWLLSCVGSIEGHGYTLVDEAASQPSPRNIEGAEPDFEDWWQGEGQFCRAGGGDYEKTFSYRAWQKATAREAALQSQIDALTLELSNEMRRQFPGIAAAHPVEGAEGWTGVYYDSARDGDGPPAVEGEAARAARQPRALWGDIRVRDAYSALKALTCSIEGSETAIERYAQACFAWARSSTPNVAARAAEPTREQERMSLWCEIDHYAGVRDGSNKVEFLTARNRLAATIDRLVPAAPLDAGAAEPVAWRVRYRSESGMIGHYPWEYRETKWRGVNPSLEEEPLYTSPPTTAAEEARDAAIVATYWISGDDRFNRIRVERCGQSVGPDKWAVRRLGDCLAKNGEWEWEPMPSSRDDDFLARCRFDTPDEAIRAAMAAAPPTQKDGS